MPRTSPAPIADCASCEISNPIQARGLCGACYYRHKADGTLDEFPLRRRAGGVVLEEWEYLRSWGLSNEEIAVKLGITRSSLLTILGRHRKKVGAT